MATDGPDPPKCNQNLYDSGTRVFMCATCGANHFENLIVDLRSKLDGIEIDWHYMFGRAVVICWPGSADIVRKGLVEHVIPKLDAKFHEQYGPLSHCSGHFM